MGVAEFHSQNRRSLQIMITWHLARPHTGQEDACSVLEGVLRSTGTKSARADRTWNKRVMAPIPLSAVRGAVACAAAETDVAAADIADNTAAAAAARTALADVAAKNIVAAANIADNAAAAAAARTSLTGVAADTAVAAADIADNAAAAADSAGDLYRRAYRVRYHCGLYAPRSARSGFRF